MLRVRFEASTWWSYADRPLRQDYRRNDMPVTVSSELEGTCALHPVKASQYAVREKRPPTAMGVTGSHPSATAFRCGLKKM